MKTITIKQPWSSLVVEGIKDVENRTCKTNFRGRVLVHAAAKPANIKYEIEGQRYSINIDIIAEQNLTAQSLAETKYRYNVNPAFSGENIPPFQLLGQKAGLVAWSCRYRWVDGGSAPYRVQDVFIEVGGKIVHLSFMAAPEDFDFGVLQFIRMAQSAQPI